MYVLFLLAVFSCKKVDKRWEEYKKKEVSARLGKLIVLPSKLDFFDAKLFTYSELIDEPLKFVSFIDGTCGVCLEDIVFLEAFAKQIVSKKLNCSFVVYIKSNDKEYFKEGILDKLKAKIPYVFDEAEVFPKLNKLWDHNFQFLLLDKEDKVLLIGNPRVNEELSNLYMEIIDGYQNQ